MRPNLAQDAPPTTITVGGVSYACDTDYRTWIEVLSRLKALNLRPKDEKAARKTLADIDGLEELIFRKRLDAPVGDVLAAVIEFSKGYPTAPVNGSDDDNAPVVSYEYDLNEIIIAIRNQSGIDLSYRCKHFHWWLFLLEFRTLCGEHYILNLMQIRGYDGKDKEMRRRRDMYALPQEFTGEELAEWEEFSSQFD